MIYQHTQIYLSLSYNRNIYIVNTTATNGSSLIQTDLYTFIVRANLFCSTHKIIMIINMHLHSTTKNACLATEAERLAKHTKQNRYKRVQARVQRWVYCRCAVLRLCGLLADSVQPKEAGSRKKEMETDRKRFNGKRVFLYRELLRLQGLRRRVLLSERGSPAALWLPAIRVGPEATPNKSK